MAAFVVGSVYTDIEAQDIALLFPGDLFVLLVGVTYLFAIAQSSGTITWLVGASVRAVGGRLALIPWVVFVVAGTLTAVGAVSPAAVAILAPLAWSGGTLWHQPAPDGPNGGTRSAGGGFSPISIYGVIVNGVVAGQIFRVAKSRCSSPASSSTPSWRWSCSSSSAASPWLKRRASPDADENDAQEQSSTSEAAEDSNEPVERLTFPRALTLAGLVVLAVSLVVFDLDVGFIALLVAVVLTLVSPKAAKDTINGISWSVVLLVGGVLTYVGVLEVIGTITYVGNTVADLGAPLLVALCSVMWAGLFPPLRLPPPFWEPPSPSPFPSYGRAPSAPSP